MNIRFCSLMIFHSIFPGSEVLVPFVHVSEEIFRCCSNCNHHFERRTKFRKLQKFPRSAIQVNTLQSLLYFQIFSLLQILVRLIHWHFTAAYKVLPASSITSISSSIRRIPYFSIVCHVPLIFIFLHR